MADEAPMSNQEKINVVSDFILHAPPGEFNEVFNDVRVLLDNDNLLKDGASGAFGQYNKDQFTPCKLQNSDSMVLITEFADRGNGRFFDPKTKQEFRYDHLKKEATDLTPSNHDVTSEPWRSALESSLEAYVKSHYPTGVVSVYGSSEGKEITLTMCIEGHQFVPRNFWNGRWRSQWTITFSEDSGKANLNGLLKVQVHYYEDGNVQLVSSKEINKPVIVSSESATAKEIADIISEEENAYQVAISENYNTMSDTTFKALRRQLPVTRTKIDWNKIIGYSIGKELGKA